MQDPRWSDGIFSCHKYCVEVERNQKPRGVSAQNSYSNTFLRELEIRNKILKYN